MYNGIGLQTARGSGTNGYVQTNKFFVRPKTTKVVVDSSKGFGPDQGTGGIGKKANKDILEHDRKRQIELKLTVLEDKLTDQGYSDAEIAEKLKGARAALEAADAVACMDGGNITTEKNVSDTQTHQIAARKEKQLETLRAALGIQLPEAKAEKQVSLDVSEIDDDEPKNYKNGSSEGDGDFEEGEIMHREDGRGARSRKEIEDSKIEKFDKKSREHVRNGKGEEDRTRKKQVRKGMHREDARKRDFSSSDTESDSGHSSGSDDDSSVDTKRKQISQRKSKKRTTYSSSDSSSRSDDSDGAYGRRGKQRQIHENKKPVQRGKRGRKERDYSVSSDSDSARVKGREADSDVDVKRKHKSVKTRKSKSKISDGSDYSSDYMQQVDKRRSDDFVKPPRRHDSDSDSDTETKTRHRAEKLEKIKSVQRGKQSGKERHRSVSSDSDPAREKGEESDSDVDIKRKHKSVKSKKGKSRIDDGSDYSSDDIQQVDGRRSDFVKPRRHDSNGDSDAEIKKQRIEKLENTKSSLSVVSDYHSGDSEREHRRRGFGKSKKAQKRHELDYGFDLETRRKDEREKSKIVNSKVTSVSDRDGDDLGRGYERKSEKSVKAPTRHDSDDDFDSREGFAGHGTQRDDFRVKRRRHDSDDDESGEAKKLERMLPDRVLDVARDVDKHKDATRGRNNLDDGYRSHVRHEDRDHKRHRRNDGEYEDKEPVDDITAGRRSDLEYKRNDRGVEDYDFRRERQDRRGGGGYGRDRRDKGEQGDKGLGDDLTTIGNRDDKEQKRKREDERLYGRDRGDEHSSKERGTREEDHHGSRRYYRDRDSSKRSRHEDSRHRERDHHGDGRWRP